LARRLRPTWRNYWLDGSLKRVRQK
jgi:hypothetical protein